MTAWYAQRLTMASNKKKRRRRVCRFCLRPRGIHTRRGQPTCASCLSITDEERLTRMYEDATRRLAS